VTVCGDIHGQLLDLFNLFETAQNPGEFGSSSEVYLFLGDYVDRGYSSLETFAYLAFLKVKYPTKIYLLRGNHESREVNQMYGLYNDCTMLYGHSGIWSLINATFDLLPIAAVVDDRIFCVHGGLTPRITYVGELSCITRQKEIDDGPLGDLTWSDPENVQRFMPNRRGKGQLFGPEQTKNFLHNNRFKTESVHGFVARSHQLAQTGYQWSHNDCLVIVWSAPNYCYKSGNEACVMKVHNGEQEFVKFEKHVDSDKQPETNRIEYFA
jgi:diadenosine tetraphosphatase ApaH/serine/threonine PP2A family protein phosphatase